MSWYARRRALLRSATIALMLAVFAGCSDSSDLSVGEPGPTPPPAATGTLEVIHASQDAPDVFVRVDGALRAGPLSFKGVSTLDVETGSRTLSVEGVVPGGNVTVIPAAGGAEPTVTVNEDERITVVAAGDLANIGPIVLTDVPPEVDAAEVRVRVLHAASIAPQVNVHITAPGAPLGPPVGTFSFGDLLTPEALVVPAGEYQIRVAPSTDPNNVVYDSGPVDLPGGGDLVVAAVANTGPGAAPIALLVATGAGVLEVLDVDTPSAVRAIHASPDAPPVDIVANDDFASPAVEDLAYGDVTGYLNPAPGPINLKVVPAGAAAPVVIDADLTLAQGTAYSVYAVGLLGDNEIAPLVLVDDVRPVASEARLRLLHASPAAGEVDIYVVGAGEGVDLENSEPAFTSVPFLADTGYVSLAAGAYDVVVTPAGSKIGAIGPLTLTFEAGGIYTAAARDEIGGGVPLGLILLDDLAP